MWRGGGFFGRSLVIVKEDGVGRGCGLQRLRLASPGKYKQKKPDLQITGHIRREILKEFRISEALGYFIGDKISIPGLDGLFSNKIQKACSTVSAPEPPLPRLCAF